MPYLTLPGVDLWYEDTGGEGTPVILLHAASGTCESWVHQLPAFTAAGYRCIAYDRRTWGRSQPTDPGQQPGFAGDDLHALVESLSLERLHLVATAAGGITALDYALAHPGAGPQPGGGQHHRRRPGCRLPGGPASAPSRGNPESPGRAAGAWPLLPGRRPGRGSPLAGD